MTLTELKYIVALSQVQHFRLAAERCNVTQPTLSVAVKKIETELGVPLFERSKSLIHVTPLGRRVVAQAQLVLEQVEVIRTLVERDKNQLEASLKLGAIYTVGPYLLPHLVPVMRDAAPDMPIYIEENFTAELRKKLQKGELDAIIISLPFKETNVSTAELYEEKFRVLMSDDHPLARSKAISPAQLSRHRCLLLGEGHCFRDQVLDACPELSHQYRGEAGDVSPDLPAARLAEGASLETLRYMVASGMGVTVLPESATLATRHEQSNLTARAFTSPQPCRTLALAWRVSFPRHKAIDVLRRAIVKSNPLGK